MSRRTLNLILLVAVMAALGATWAMRPRLAVPNHEFMPEMVRTPRYNAYSANPIFADGKTLQAPPAGTIPRGLPPLHFNATPEDALRAGKTLQAPVQPASSSRVMNCCKTAMETGMTAGTECCMGMVTAGQSDTAGLPPCCSGMKAVQDAKAAQARAVERGAVVFARFCQPCHGSGGKGDGQVVAKGYPGPPSLFAENAITMKDGQLFHIVTYGQKNMPGHAAQLSRQDRWNVIAHVRSLQAKALAPPADAVASATAASVPPSASQTGGQP